MHLEKRYCQISCSTAGLSTCLFSLESPDNNAFRDAFSNLGHCDLTTAADFADIEKFTCACMGCQNSKNKITDACFVMFQ